MNKVNILTGNVYLSLFNPQYIKWSTGKQRRNLELKISFLSNIHLPQCNVL
jgi:hypothetical protein